MDVKDLLELAKDPAKYEAILKNIEDQRTSLQEDINAFGGVQAIKQARANISEQLNNARVQADDIVRDAQMQANRIVDEAKKQAEVLAKRGADLGLKEDQLLAKEKDLSLREDKIRQEEDAVRRAYAAAKKEQDKVTERNKELEDTLSKIKSVL